MAMTTGRLAMRFGSRLGLRLPLGLRGRRRCLALSAAAAGVALAAVSCVWPEPSEKVELQCLVIGSETLDARLLPRSNSGFVAGTESEWAKLVKFLAAYESRRPPRSLPKDSVAVAITGAGQGRCGSYISVPRLESRGKVLEVDYQYMQVEERDAFGGTYVCTAEGTIESLVMFVPKEYAQSVSFKPMPIRHEVVYHEVKQPCPVLSIVLPKQ
jgi:hypothetical protein